MTAAYVLGALIAWPILVVALAVKTNGLRRGPSLSTVAVIAGLMALVWPLGLALAYLMPTVGRSR